MHVCYGEHMESRDNLAESGLPLSGFRELNSGHQVHITVPDLLSHLADSVFPLYIFLNFLKLYLFLN